MIIEPVYGVITGYVDYGSVVSSLPGPCGQHRYLASVMTPDGLVRNFGIIGSVEQCWPAGLHVQPLPIGRGINGIRTQEGVGNYSYQWFYRETPLVGPCNPGGG